MIRHQLTCPTIANRLKCLTFNTPGRSVAVAGMRVKNSQDYFLDLCGINSRFTVNIRQFVCFWRDSPPSVPWPPHSRGFQITHKTTHHSRQNSSGRVISSSQRPLRDNTQYSQQISMPPVGFEPTVSAGERPQTYAFDRAATGTGKHMAIQINKIITIKQQYSSCWHKIPLIYHLNY